MEFMTQKHQLPDRNSNAVMAETMAKNMEDDIRHYVREGISIKDAHARVIGASCAGHKTLELLRDMIHSAPAKVRSSQFGCMNCLWASSECSFGSSYIETEPVELGRKKVATCKSYTYYD